MDPLTTRALPSIDADYTFGRPVESYLTVRQHARLEIVRARVMARQFPVSGDVLTLAQKQAIVQVEGPAGGY